MCLQRGLILVSFYQPKRVSILAGDVPFDGATDDSAERQIAWQQDHISHTRAVHFLDNQLVCRIFYLRGIKILTFTCQALSLFCFQKLTCFSNSGLEPVSHECKHCVNIMNCFNLQKVNTCLTLGCEDADGRHVNTFHSFQIACWVANSFKFVLCAITNKDSRSIQRGCGNKSIQVENIAD